MSIPQVNITFKKTANNFIERGKTGTLAVILRGTAAATYTLQSTDDIPSTLTAANKSYLERAFEGAENKPDKILLFVIGKDDQLTATLGTLQTKEFDWLVGPPELTSAEGTTISTWIKTERARGHFVKAVLPGTAADSEGVVNFANTTIKAGSTTYTAAQYASRIAGILCGTPITQSATYTALPEVTDTESFTDAELKAAVAAGKLVIFNDGEKVKILQAVTSQTTAEGKIEDFKKIKIVAAADMIRKDIKKTADEKYIGKLANTYDNKCVLMVAVDTYFRELARQGVVTSGAECAINEDAQRTYLTEHGVDVSELSAQQIKEYPTGEYVYLQLEAGILDAIEIINLDITI